MTDTPQPPPVPPVYLNVSMQMRDHVIVPRYRYEHLLRLEAYMKVGLLVFTNGQTALEAEISARAQEAAKEESGSPSRTQANEDMCKVVFGTVPGFEWAGAAKPKGDTDEEEESEESPEGVDSSTPPEPADGR